MSTAPHSFISRKSPSRSGRSGRRVVASFPWLSSATATLCACALLLPTFAKAKKTCDTSLGEFYPYCVNVPDNAGSKDMPTVLFLSGRGARGSPSQVESLSTYDGFGKLTSQYESGNKGEAQTLAAEEFITIVPVAPASTSNGLDPQYWYPELLEKVVEDVKSKYNVDANKFYVAGYSMGAFGTWRYATYSPNTVAAIVPSGGNAETNEITNSLHNTAKAPFDLLSLVKKIPVRAFVGSQDTTVPPSGAEATQAELEKIGDSNSKLTILDTDHSGLSVGPFDADTLKWMLSQSLDSESSGSSSSSSSSTESETSSTSSSSDSQETTGPILKGVSSDDDGESEDTSSSSTGTATSSTDGSGTSSGNSSSSSTVSTKKTCRRRRGRRDNVVRSVSAQKGAMGAMGWHRVLRSKRDL